MSSFYYDIDGMKQVLHNFGTFKDSEVVLLLDKFSDPSNNLDVAAIKALTNSDIKEIMEDVFMTCSRGTKAKIMSFVRNIRGETAPIRAYSTEAPSTSAPAGNMTTDNALPISRENTLMSIDCSSVQDFSICKQCKLSLKRSNTQSVVDTMRLKCFHVNKAHSGFCSVACPGSGCGKLFLRWSQFARHFYRCRSFKLPNLTIGDGDNGFEPALDFVECDDSVHMELPSSSWHSVECSDEGNPKAAANYLLRMQGQHRITERVTDIIADNMFSLSSACLEMSQSAYTQVIVSIGNAELRAHWMSGCLRKLCMQYSPIQLVPILLL